MAQKLNESHRFEYGEKKIKNQKNNPLINLRLESSSISRSAALRTQRTP